MSRHVADRTGEDLFSMAQNQRIRENMLEHAARNISPATQKLYREYSEVSTANVAELMALIAKHGGRIDVAGFGTFFVRDIAGKEIFRDGKKAWRAPYRRIEFKQSKLMRDMLNLDHEHQEAADPNPEFFEGLRNLRVL